MILAFMCCVPYASVNVEVGARVARREIDYTHFRGACPLGIGGASGNDTFPKKINHNGG